MTKNLTAAGVLWLLLSPVPAPAMCLEDEVRLQEVTVFGCRDAREYTRELVGQWLRDDERQSWAQEVLTLPSNSKGVVLAVRVTREVVVVPEYEVHGYDPNDPNAPEVLVFDTEGPSRGDGIRLDVTYPVQSDQLVDREELLYWAPTEGGSCHDLSAFQPTALHTYQPCCDQLPSRELPCVAKLSMAGPLPKWAEPIMNAQSGG